ncbi:MAG: SAM-dependent methyltransferase [Xanthomonadales bacterium]|nr:SAM-dependent methyltransferase [Xanthomonadales bacterium]
MAPRTKADYAFLLHDLYHLKPDGIMTIVLPHGVLFRGGEEGKIRKQLIEQNHIHAVIGLPANIFFGTGIPTIILVLRQKRTNTNVLIVDASKHFLKVGKNNKLQASDIKRIADTVIYRESTAKYSRVVSKATIRENDYSLNIPRYVDASIDAESWDLHATMLGGIPEKEINQLDNYWQAFPALRETLFKQTSSDYSQLKISTNALKHSITQHPQVKAFSQDFLSAFNGFDDYLKSELIAPFIDSEGQQGQSIKININIGQQEAILSQELFTRLDPIALIDKYQAHQLLDNSWQIIAPDLEMLQSEGFAASKQVDPHMVNKKVKGKDTEVQDGWVGHILPFDVVQNTYLKGALHALKQKENRLTEISAEFEAILESLTEEEKEADTIKESNDGFINAAVIKAAKQLRAEIKTNGDFEAESYATKILKVDALILEEKKLKKSVKTDAEALHLQTKATIEALSDEQVHELLERKWISPLLGELGKLPDDLINQLTRKVQHLADKYATTYGDIAKEIHNTEKELGGLIDELEGNAFDRQALAEFQSFLQGE